MSHIGLPVEQLREPIRNCITGVENRQEAILDAINRRGRKIQCRISYNPLMGSDRECLGVIVLTEEV
jgi:two-component system CheB/CheR fusion protein